MKTNHIYNSVERLAELLKVGARQAGAAHGLQPVQLEVLNYLSACNKYSDTPMAVTEYLGQTKGTVSQTIKTLEKKELVIKTADENDKRISHIAVTPLGREILNEHLPTEMFVNACSTLSNPAQEQVLSALTSLLTSVIKSNNMKTFGTCYSCRHNHKHDDESYFCNLLKEPLRDSDVLLICREHENSSDD